MDELSNIFTSSTGRIQVGVDAQGGWCANVSERHVRLDRRAAFRALMPLLEEEPGTVAAAINRPGIPPFPLEELVLCALCFFSAYWKELALHWIETLGIQNEAIDVQLTEIAATESRWPRSLKQMAARILRSRT